MSIQIKSFSSARFYHREYINKLKMLESISPHMRELFEKISDAEYGLTLVECTRSDDRVKMNETKIRLDMLRLDGHILLIEGRYYNKQHIETEEI
jgi:hypothetical protein